MNYSSKETENYKTDSIRKLVPGGYVCQIIEVTMDMYDNMRVYYEIVEGDYKNYARDYRESPNRSGNLSSPIFDRFPQTERAAWKTYSLLKAVTETNKGFKFDGAIPGDEKKLEKKGVGIIFGYEEGANGRVYVKPRKYVSAETIRSGNFEVPTDTKSYKGVKTPEDNIPAEMTPVEDEDLPF